MAKLTVLDKEINIMKVQENDYISLTDMLKAKDGDFFISDWLRNRNTIEYIGIWERIHNPDFNYGEFAIIKSQAGLNNYKISVKEWANKTNAIGLVAKAGRYGGTYAHSDIAFEFGMWISAVDGDGLESNLSKRSTELAANLFRATQAEEKLKRDNIQGKANANQTHHEVGKKIRQTIIELGGEMPEDLPNPTKSVKSIEKEQAKLEKK